MVLFGFCVERSSFLRKTRPRYLIVNIFGVLRLDRGKEDFWFVVSQR